MAVKQHRFLVGVLSGLVIAALAALPLYAQVVSWSRAQVRPVVLVEYSLGSFVPIGQTGFGPHWRKSEVIPMVITKPQFTGFVPVTGNAIGLSWTESQVVPIIYVKPGPWGFVPEK